METIGNPSREAPCIVCQGEQFLPYRDIRSQLSQVPGGLDRGSYVHVSISRCQACGLLRLEGNRSSPSNLYEDESISFDASTSKLDVTTDNETIYSRDEFDLITLPSGRLLDIGCSSGYFLRRAVARGWEAYGVEPDPKAAAHANAVLGLNVTRGTLRETSFAAGFFDVVTLWGVLEHLPDPDAELRLIHSLLRNGGQLVIAVPHVRSLNRMASRLSPHDWDMFLEPGHLYHFDISTLTRLVQNAGFRRLGWRTATCAIRGKLPFLPWRPVRIEQRIASLCRRSSSFAIAYRSFLRALDALHLGDVLMASFEKE